MFRAVVQSYRVDDAVKAKSKRQSFGGKMSKVYIVWEEFEGLGEEGFAGSPVFHRHLLSIYASRDSVPEKYKRDPYFVEEREVIHI